LIIKTHTGTETAVKPTATGVEAAVNLGENLEFLSKIATSVKPKPTSTSLPSL
jgi:hypothetical protein